MVRRKLSATDTFWMAQTRKLETYASNKGWSVVYTSGKKNSEADFVAKKLLIEIDVKSEHTFYYFLHEIGHMLLCQNSKTYAAKYETVYEDFHATSLTHKVNRVEEEFDAWKSGRRLARRLSLKVNRREFEKLRTKCLASYMMWVVNRKIQVAQKKKATTGSKL